MTTCIFNFSPSKSCFQSLDVFEYTLAKECRICRFKTKILLLNLMYSTNILATRDNLKRWGKVRSDNCKICISTKRFPHKATLFHILNNFDALLGEGERMTLRHNSIFKYIANTRKYQNLFRSPQLQDKWCFNPCPYHGYQV